MKYKKAYVFTGTILCLIALTYGYNRLYSLFLNKEYTVIDHYAAGAKYKIRKLALDGKIVFKPIDLPGADPGVIYFDTLLRQFQITTQTYTDDRLEQNNVYTLDGEGNVLTVDQYVPNERDSSYQIDKITRNGFGKIISRIKNVAGEDHYGEDHYAPIIPITALLPPWPKYRDKSSPVYIRHFDQAQLNLSDLNPLRLAGMNGGRPSAAWTGIAYCDVTFLSEILKIKLPFDKDNLFFSSNDFYADMQYYVLPKKYARALDVAFLKIDEDIYMIEPK